MNLHIGTFCNHVWNLAIYLDMGDSDAANAEQQGLHDWWDRTQDEIEGFVTGLTDPLRNDVDELLTWANDFYDWTTAQIGSLGDRIEERYGQAKTYCDLRIVGTLLYIDQQDAAIQEYFLANKNNWLTNLLNSAWQGLGDLVEDPIGWLRWLLDQTFIGCQDLWADLQGTWEWLKSWVRWAVEWLDWASDRLEWVLVNTLDMLYQLLVSPLEYVTGALYHSLLFWYDVWLYASANLGYFVQVVLADLLTLWDMYKVHIKAFLKDPMAWFVANVENPFIDWSCGVIADRW